MIQKNRNIVLRNIHGVYFLIDIKANFLDEKCELYEIDSIGAYIWETMNDYDTIKDISMRLKKILIEDIPLEQLISDVSDLMLSLSEQNFITEN